MDKNKLSELVNNILFYIYTYMLTEKYGQQIFHSLTNWGMSQLKIYLYIYIYMKSCAIVIIDRL